MAGLNLSAALGVGLVGFNKGASWVPLGAAFASEFAADRHFVANQLFTSLDDLIASDAGSFARAGAGGYIDGAGAVQLFDAGQPRRGARGLLVEPSAKNQMLNNAAADYVSGSPGTMPTNWGSFPSSTNGLARANPGKGLENGVPYIDIRYSGTTTAATAFFLSFAVSTSTFAIASGETGVFSAWLKLVAGDFDAFTSALLVLRNRDSTTTQLSSEIDLKSAIDETWQRIEIVRAAQSTSVSQEAVLRLQPPTATAIDFTLRIGLPQHEIAATASAPIVTSGSAVTRPADALTYFPGAGTYDVTVTFDDDSTQELAAVEIDEDGWTVPANLNRRYISKIVAFAA